MAGGAFFFFFVPPGLLFLLFCALMESFSPSPWEAFDFFLVVVISLATAFGPLAVFNNLFFLFQAFAIDA